MIRTILRALSLASPTRADNTLSAPVITTATARICLFFGLYLGLSVISTDQHHATDPRRLEHNLVESLNEWPTVLRRHAQQARQMLRKLVDERIVFTRVERPGGGDDAMLQQQCAVRAGGDVGRDVIQRAMPDYREKLTVSELIDLVAYLKDRDGGPEPARN